MRDRKRSVKAAELASSLGAGVLGSGLALVLPVSLRVDGWTLLLAGAVVHGAGMTLKYRLETRNGPRPWWERALFWLCWAILGTLAMWLGITAVALPS